MTRTGLFFLVKQIAKLIIALYILFHAAEWNEKIYSWELMRTEHYVESELHWHNLFQILMIIPIWMFFSNFFVWNLIKMGRGGYNNDSLSGQNIENLKRYRNAKMSTMSNSAAAEEYRKTAWIDGLSGVAGYQTKITRNYINAKLGNMSNENGVKWAKGKN
jgi:hypothetical protein